MASLQPGPWRRTHARKAALSSVKPGDKDLRYTVHIKGDAMAEQFEKVHEIVKATSPNRFNVATAIALKSQFVAEN